MSVSFSCNHVHMHSEQMDFYKDCWCNRKDDEAKRQEVRKLVLHCIWWIKKTSLCFILPYSHIAKVLSQTPLHYTSASLAYTVDVFWVMRQEESCKSLLANTIIIELNTPKFIHE